MVKHVYVEILHNLIQKYNKRPCFYIKRNGKYKTWTFGEFHKDLNRLSSALKKYGLKKGDNAIVIGENSPEWVIAHHAIILTGACAVPVDPNIPPSEIESITALTEAKIVFCTSPYLKMFKGFKAQYSFIDKLIILDPESDEKETFYKVLKNGQEEKNAFELQCTPDDPMVIIFTSGTTGNAKGVVLCQKNFTAVQQHAIPRMNLKPNDIACAVLPLHHVFGFAASIAGPLAAGASIVFVPHVKSPLILEALRDKEVTYLPAVPKMLALFYDGIIHNIKKKGPLVRTLFSGMNTLSRTAGPTLGNGFQRNLFSSVHKSFGGKLRLIISGGAALNKKHWNGFRQLGFTIVEGYGLTETFGPITVSPGEDARPGSVGRALDENEIRIDNPDHNGIGEVLLRGTCVFKGYYKNHEQTLQVFDNEGWFHTGDLGRLDKDGFLYLLGRKKDMIVLDNGKNVYPDELEDIYSTSPLIEEIGVFGVVHDECEVVVAAIVPSKEIQTSKTLSEAASILFDELTRIGKGLPVYRRITDFVTLYTPLPRTTTRKIKRHDLKKIYNSIKRKSSSKTSGTEQLSVMEIAMMETHHYASTIKAIITVAPKTDERIINPRSHLEIDLGLDSLEKVELLSTIEQMFNITISDTVFEKMETVADLVSLVMENQHSKGVSTVTSILNFKTRLLNETPEFIKFPPKSKISDAVLPHIGKLSPFYRHAKEIKGLERLLNINLPMIFIANHNQPEDILTILESLPHNIRKETVTFNDPLLKNFFSKIHFFQDHLLNLEKPNDPLEILKMSISVIRSGKNLILFPEGNISKPGILGPLKNGACLLAKETEAMIIPMKISGPFHLQSSTMPSDVTNLIIGKPLQYSDLFEDRIEALKASVSDASAVLRRIIEKL
ncbi:MAG TPA: AMP-binding protein [Chitinispirillaceae bacterium]|nr:AMP-binding protein [Chitinispirillaceae bacterium]